MKTAFLFRHPHHAPRQTRADPQLRRAPRLHRRGRGHPIAVVTTLAVGAFAGMMLAPASGSALSSTGSLANAIETAHTTPKTSRLSRASSTMTVMKAAPETVKTPSACTPSSTAPSHAAPIAYV